MEYIRKIKLVSSKVMFYLLQDGCRPTFHDGCFSWQGLSPAAAASEGEVDRGLKGGAT